MKFPPFFGVHKVGGSEKKTSPKLNSTADQYNATLYIRSIQAKASYGSLLRGVVTCDMSLWCSKTRCTLAYSARYLIFLDLSTSITSLCGHSTESFSIFVGCFWWLLIRVDPVPRIIFFRDIIEVGMLVTRVLIFHSRFFEDWWGAL